MSKKNKVMLYVVFFVIVGIIFVIWFNSTNKSHQSDEYTANRTSSTETQDNNIIKLKSNTVENNPISPVKQPELKEEELTTFSTKIYSSDSARQNNIQITCNTLNDFIVKNGETFSFCDTVGQSSTSKGYQKADIFDSNGNKKKGLGGGNCQVSSTLYNAVLNVPGLVVTERHEHSNYVPYIQRGKDAAVAYGSYDLKFRNNTGNDIKIKASATAEAVTTSIMSLKYE